MPVNCSHEKNDILYCKARANFAQDNAKRILWYDVVASKQKHESMNLDTFVPDYEKGNRPLETIVISECYSRDNPLDVRECKTGDFWDYLQSEDWSEGSSLRVLSGRLQDQIIEGLAYMEKIGLIAHRSTYAYAVNIRRRKLCFGHNRSKGMDDIMNRKETILLEFGYYGPYREDRQPKYHNVSGSSGYQESSTSTLPPLSSSKLSVFDADKSESRYWRQGKERLDVITGVGRLRETSDTTVVTSTLQTKESVNNLPRIHVKNTVEQAPRSNRTMSQISGSVKEEEPFTPFSSSPPKLLLPLLGETTFSTKTGSPNQDGSDILSVDKSRTLFPQDEILSQLISDNSTEDSHNIGKVSSQVKVLHTPSMTLKDKVKYSGSSTNSSLFSETGTVSLQNFMCTEKVFYLGSFNLDSQSDSDSSENEDVKIEVQSKAENLLGDVHYIEENESVLKKLRRKNKKRIEEREQKKTMLQGKPKTLPNLMIWSELKEADNILQCDNPAKELFSNMVPNFADLNNKYGKYKTEALMRRKAKIKQLSVRQQTNMQNHVLNTENRDSNQAKISHLEQQTIQTEIKSTDILKNFKKFKETVGGITNSAACKNYCSDLNVLLDWLERHNLQNTFFYRKVKKKKESVLLQKVGNDILSLQRPKVKNETAKMKLGDEKSDEQSIKLRKNEKKGNKEPNNLDQGQKEIRSKKKSVDMTETIRVEPFHIDNEQKTVQKKKKQVDSRKGENHNPLMKMTKDGAVTKKLVSLGKTLSDTSSEEDLSNEDSIFDVKKLNLRYSIENIPNQKQKEVKPSPLEILRKYFRIQKIANSFCRNLSSINIKPMVQFPRLWERTLGKKGGLKSLKQPQNIGRLKWFSFLSKADVDRKTPNVKPAFEMIYTTDFMVKNLKKALERFVVRKETVMSDYKGETCITITFTKPSVFQIYKKIDTAC